MTQRDPPSPFGNDPDAIHRLFIEMLPPDVHLTQLLGEWLPADQLKAIKELLHRNHQAAEASRIKFDELRQQLNATPDNEQLDRLHDDRFWSRVFMDSAHSMSAVGMLAPFMESLFGAIFAGLRRWQVEDLGSTRRQRADVGRLTAPPAQPSKTTEKSGRSRIGRTLSRGQVAERCPPSSRCMAL